MSTGSLEERVEALETQYARLLDLLQRKPPKEAWRSVVGMFADDPRIEDLHKEVLQIREADRIATRDNQAEP